MIIYDDLHLIINEIRRNRNYLFITEIITDGN